MGCVRLSERFLKHDPPAVDDLKEMLKFVDGMIADTIGSIKNIGITIVIATAGTATNLSAMNMGLLKYDPKAVHMSKVNLNFIERQFKKLSSMTAKQRKQVIGLEPARADVIVGGIAVIMRTLEMLGRDEIIVSEKDILDGIILELLDCNRQ